MERKKNGALGAYKGELNAIIKGDGGRTQAREDGEVDGAQSDGEERLRTKALAEAYLMDVEERKVRAGERRLAIKEQRLAIET